MGDKKIETVTKFMMYVWELGLTVELGEKFTSYFAHSHHRHREIELRLRNPKSNINCSHVFTNFDHLSQALDAGIGEDLCRRLMIPPFKDYEGPFNAINSSDSD